MMRILILFLGISLLSSTLQGQKDSLLFRVKKEHNSFRVDELENLYLIDRVEIGMWNKQGKHQFNYSQNSLGRIGDVDLSRSLKPLVFYPDLSTLVVMDNTLSVQGTPIDLNRYELDQAELVCNSVNAHFWFYDGSRNELIRTDRSFNITSETGDLVRLLNIRLNPTQIIEFRERLYLNAPSQGILVFDIFGSHMKTLRIKGAEHFQISRDYIHYMKDGKLYYYDRDSHDKGTIELPEEDVEQARIGRKRLYISNGERVSVYRSKQKVLPKEESKVNPKGDR